MLNVCVAMAKRVMFDVDLGTIVSLSNTECFRLEHWIKSDGVF